MKIQMKFKGTIKWIDIKQEDARIALGRYFKEPEKCFALMRKGEEVYTQLSFYRQTPNSNAPEETNS